MKIKNMILLLYIPILFFSTPVFSQTNTNTELYNTENFSVEYKNKNNNDPENFYNSLLGRNDLLSNQMLSYSKQSLEYSKNTINYFLAILGLLGTAALLFGYKTLKDVKESTKKQLNQIAQDEVRKITNKLNEHVKNIDEKLRKQEEVNNLWQKFKEVVGLNKKLELINKIIETNDKEEKKFILYGNKGTVLYQLNRYHEAVECFDTVLELEQNDARAYYYKGRCFLHLEKEDEALKVFNQGILVNPNNYELINCKAETLQLIKNYEEAIVCFKKARELEIAQKDKDPDCCDYASYAISISFCYLKLKKFEEAYKIAKTGRFVGFRVELLVNQGLAAAGLGKREQAIKLIMDAKDTGIRNTEVTYCLARAHSLLKNKDEAITNLKYAINQEKKWAKISKTEEDFNFIKDSDEFIEITNVPTPNCTNPPE